MTQQLVGRVSETPTAANPGTPIAGQGLPQIVLLDPYGRVVTIAGNQFPEVPLRTVGQPDAGNPAVPAIVAYAGGPCRLFEVWGFSGLADAYMMVFDSNVLPVLGDAPAVANLAVPTLVGGRDFSLDPSTKPAFTRGIAVALSSTPNRYTPFGASSAWAIQVLYGL